MSVLEGSSVQAGLKTLLTIPEKLHAVKCSTILPFPSDHSASWKENTYTHISIKRSGIRWLSHWSVKTSFCLDTLLISAGDSLPECTGTQSTLIQAWNLITSSIFTQYSLRMSEPCRGRLFISHVPVQNRSIHNNFFQLFLNCTDVTDSKFSSILLRKCAWDK